MDETTNYKLVWLIFGMIFGFFLMYVTSNIQTYHGPNSNDVRHKVFTTNGKKYKFIPHVIGT